MTAAKTVSKPVQVPAETEAPVTDQPTDEVVEQLPVAPAQAEPAPTARSGFEPGRYLTKVGGADYLEVKWRLVWLREVHPDAVVETELVSHVGQDAIFRARVTIPGGGSATGFGSEAYDDFRDYIEKAETKALGRALAALGFGTQFCPDFEFGAREGRVVDTPVDFSTTRGRRMQGAVPSSAPRMMTAPRAAQDSMPDASSASMSGNGDRSMPAQSQGGAQSGNVGTVTPKQVKFIQAIARELRLSEEALSDEAERLYGSPITELGRRDASSFIERLQARRGASPDSLAS